MSSSRFIIGFLTGAAVSLTLTFLVTRHRRESSSPSSSHHVGDDHHIDNNNSKKQNRDRESSTSSNETNFLSDLVKEMWCHIDVYLSTTIRQTVEPMLATTLPAPFNSLKFAKLSLGNHPIRFDHVIVHEASARTKTNKERSDTVKLDMNVVWNSDCEIQLEGSMGMTVGVEHISFQGRLACRFHPTDTSPMIVSAVTLSLINAPTLDLDFTGLAAVADIQMIKNKVIDSIQQSMAAMMVLPASVLVRVDPKVNFVDVYTPPRGILRVCLKSGEGFQVQKRMMMLGKEDVVDVYCGLSLGDKTWTSSSVENSLTPTWNETVDFVFHDVEQALAIHAWDRDRGVLESDDHLGVAHVTVGQALSAPNRTIHVELLSTSGKKPTSTGIVVTLSFESLSLVPTWASMKSFSPNCISGIMEILVVAARHLPIAKESAASYVKVTVGTHEFVTGTVVDSPGVDALNPLYDCGFVLPIQDMNDLENDIVFTLYTAQTILGSHTVTMTSLIESPDHVMNCQEPIGDKVPCQLEFCVWIRGTESNQGASDESLLPPVSKSPASSPRRQAPLLQSHSSATTSTVTSNSSPPPPRSSIPSTIITRQAVGTVRVTVIKGFGFKPHRRIFRKLDIPNVYCRVQVSRGGVDEGNEPVVWQTKTIRESVNPMWNETHEFEFYDLEQDAITIHVYDEDPSKLNRDDLIGHGHVAIKTLLAMTLSRPVDVAIARKGKGTVAFIAVSAQRLSSK